MNSSAALETHERTGTCEYVVRVSGNDTAESAEAPGGTDRAGRGAVTGLLLGASLWAVILALFGVIKF